jgi:hypothetical protein
MMNWTDGDVAHWAVLDVEYEEQRRKLMSGARARPAPGQPATVQSRYVV